MESFKPHRPVVEQFLSYRQQAYRNAGHRSAAQADRDLQEFSPLRCERSGLIRIGPLMVTKGTSVSQELPPFSADPGHSAASSFPLELPVRTSGGIPGQQGAVRPGDPVHWLSA